LKRGRNLDWLSSFEALQEVAVDMMAAVAVNPREAVQPSVTVDDIADHAEAKALDHVGRRIGDFGTERQEGMIPEDGLAVPVSGGAAKNRRTVAAW
jgi:hypothetical protein